MSDDDTTAADEHDEAATDEPVEDEAPAADGDEDEAPAAKDAAEAKKPTADAAARKVTRRTVVSRRVTPKGGAPAEPTSSSKARDARKTETVVTRTPPPSQQTYPKGPSPWWVPTLMFGLLIIGALIIMANYMVGDSASNTRLVIGLAFILGGIVTATQYR